jgi:hypothetical protein
LLSIDGKSYDASIDHSTANDGADVAAGSSGAHNGSPLRRDERWMYIKTRFVGRLLAALRP